MLASLPSSLSNVASLKAWNAERERRQLWEAGFLSDADLRWVSRVNSVGSEHPWPTQKGVGGQAFSQNKRTEQRTITIVLFCLKDWLCRARRTIQNSYVHAVRTEEQPVAWTTQSYNEESTNNSVRAEVCKVTQPTSAGFNNPTLGLDHMDRGLEINLLPLTMPAMFEMLHSREILVVAIGTRGQLLYCTFIMFTILKYFTVMCNVQTLFFLTTHYMYPSTVWKNTF